MSKRLRISPTEYYNTRRKEDDGGIFLTLSPYSCLRQMYFQIDKTREIINVVFQGLSLYQGEVDFDKITIGMKVEPVFKEKREGNMLDIKYFRPARGG